MAVQDCDKISNIVAVAIAAGDDDLAKDIAQLSAVKNDAIQRSRKLRETGEAIDVVTGYTPHELELRASSADIQIRAIVQSKILDGSKGAEAQMELAKQIKKTGGSMAGGANLLEMVSKAPMADYEEIAKLWDDTMDVSEAMADLNKGLSDFVSSNYSIRKYSDFYEGEVSKAKNKLKDKKITQEEYEKEISEAHNNAMKKIAKGENPSGFIPLDNEWQAIKKVFGDNPKEAGKKWSQYVMARELLADGGLDDNLIKAFNFGGEKLTGDLTIRQINECEDLDVLLSRAFTNTEQLYTDGELREAYRSRLAQLASGKTLTEKNERKIRTLVNVSLFAEEGATLSNILLDNRAYLSVRQMGFKTSERNGGKIYDGLRSFAKKLADGKDKDILNGTIKIGGLEMEPKHIVQLIYDITGDKNILALMNAGNFSDTAILDVATQKLLGDNEKAKASLIKLFQKGKEGNKITNTRGVFLRAVTGLDVPDGAKVGFFDYRKGLYYKDELSSTKADFYDKLAEKNKMKVTEGVQDFTSEVEATKENEKELAARLEREIGGGFLIVNDDGYNDNPLLRNALNSVSKDKEITVLFPRGGAMANFSIGDNGTIFYKTINDELFDRVAGTVSIQSMGEAKPTREMLASAYEAQTGRNGDKLRYQPMYTYGAVDSKGRQISDQVVDFFTKSAMRDDNGNLVRGYRGATDYGTGLAFKKRDDLNKSSYGRHTVLFFTDNEAIAESLFGGPVRRKGGRIKTLEDAVNELKTRGKSEYYSIEKTGDGQYRIYKNNEEWGADNGKTVVEGDIATIDRYLMEDVNPLSGEIGGVYECYLYAENPLIVDANGAMRSSIKFNGKEMSTDEIAKYAADNGYDGVIIKNVNEGGNTVGLSNDYIVFGESQIKAVDNELPTNDYRMRFQLIGPQGLERLIKDYPDYVSKYTEAVKMLEAGASSDDIYTKTGLSVSARGDIEFEIPGTNKFTPTLQGFINDVESGEAKDWGKMKASAKKQIKTIGDMIDNPELFAAYPELKDVPVELKAIKGYSGMYYPKSNRFAFDVGNITSYDESDWREIIAHEVQHYIQHQEGHGFKVHPSKYSNKQERKAVDFLYRKIKNNLKDIEIPEWVLSSYGARYPKLMFVHEHYDEIMNWLKTNDSASLALWDKELKAYEKIEKNWDEGRKKLFENMDKHDIDAYYREAGESQSYAVGYREGKRDATRGTPPSWQEPFPREMQLMRDMFGNEITGYHYIPAALEDNFQQQYMDALFGGNEKLLKSVLDEYAMVKHFEPFKGEIDLDELPPEIAENFREQFRTVIWNDKPMSIEKVPVAATTSNVPTTSGLKLYVEQETISAPDAVKLKAFTTGRTWAEIAVGYGFPVKIVQGEMIEGVRAWGAWGRGFIWFTDLVKEGTAPHELFHAVFNTWVGEEQYNRVLADASKLFQVNARDAEEILADSFSEYFLTGKFTYGDKIKAITGKKKLSEEQKTYLQRVKDFFLDLAETLGLVDRHRAEVEKMFEDIVNMKYLPDAGKPVSPDEAMVRYNKELNDAAVKYYGAVLGEGTDVVDAAYTEKVQTVLSDMLGIDIAAFNTFTDKSKLWQRIDKQLSLERLTAGRFDREIIDVGKERQRIYNLSDEDLAKEINDKFGVLVRGGTIVGNENLPIIKEAWFNYNRATNIDDLLSAEGSIISLVNGTQGTKVSVDDLKTMFQNKTFKEKYKEMFFLNQDLTDEDWKLFIDQINSDLFDGLSIQFSENLVKAGYSLPLINTKKVVYDYLNGKLDLNSNFVQAFFYKNNIPFTRDDLNAIMDTMMPKEFKFDFATYTAALEDENIAGDISRVIESKNRFLPDSYSALAAIEDSGKGITLGNKETAVLESMLNKYIDEVLAGMSKGTLKFDGAQRLKQELSYALDTFEQDFILPKYGTFLTPQDKQVIFGIKYDIPIGVSGQPYSRVENMLRDTKDRIMSNYRRVLGTMASNNDINEAIAKGYNADITPDDIQKRIENRRNQLISNGSTIKEINGDYVVYSVKDALRETIETLPSNIQGVAGLRAIGREGIEGMSNKQAYILLRYLEATKSLATTANYATQLMYKQTPQLAQYSFFSTYVIDETTGLPKIMASNSLAADTFFDNKLSSVAVDQAIKEEIFEKVVNKFKKDGYILANTVKKSGKIVEKGLDDIISEAVNRQIDDIHSIKFAPDEIETAKSKMQNIYTNMFIPYTYLRDIPSGGTTKAGTKLIDVKEKVTSTMRAAYTQAKKDLEDAGATNADKIQQAITVKLDDGQVMDLDSLAKLDADSWKEQIFNDKSIAVKSADADATFETEDYKNILISDEKAKRRAEKAEKDYRESVQNEYLSSLQAILNDGQIISDGERSMMTSFMLDVRTDLRKYTLTSKLVDALDSLSGINEEVARGIKNYLIGLGGVVTFGKFFSGDILRRLELVKDAYRGYYGMSLEQLIKVTPGAPGGAKTQAEVVAWNTARYFKNLERLLGSVDGKTGVTTSERVNKAFYHLGETFLNLNTETNGRSVRGIFSMLSAIEQNQVLKFFKFSNSGQQSYVKEFVQGTARDGKDSIWDGLRGYKDYVQDITNINREQFNILFGTSYGDKQFKRVLQGLTGFTLASGTAYRKINQFLDLLNSSWTALRMVMSYPGQLLTVPLQGVAYFLKQVGYELKLGIESISDIDNIRETFGILDGAYNELNILGKLNFNPDSKDISSFYNRYGIPDIKEALKGTNISTADDFVNMYAKIDTKYSKPGFIQRAVKWFDPYKDNANNFIDGIFARNFKNIAFVKGLKDNNFMKFSDASSFLEFMNNPEINNEIKSRLLDAVAAASGRNFRNILGLGFGGLDRAVGGAEWQTIIFGLMQMFNFRGSWGQNIFKQTGTNLMHMLRWLGSNVGLSKASKDEVAKFIAYSPEFNNFMTAFLTDMEWAFKLTRYQDNGRRPDEDEDGIHYFLDYLSFFGENMNMVSQRWQGIQSFGPIRPFLEQWQSMIRTQMDPTVYHDTYGLGAFFNAFGKNFLRQWKPVNWVAELIGAFEEGGPANARAYFNNKVLNLSFGTIRYMVNEDMNGYGYTYEVTGQYGGIPGVVMGEAQFGSDKSFMYELDNDETWSNLQLYFGDDLPWSERKVYGKNLWKSFVNGSQFASALKNLWKISPWGEYTKSFFTADDLSDTLQKTPAGQEFYSKGYVTPKTIDEANTFFKTILNHSEYRPGSSNFSKSIMQFEDLGHMDAAKGNAADADMELWLEHMKYQTNENGEFVKKDGKKVIDPSWTDLMTNIKTYGGNEEYVTKTIYNYSKAWLDTHSSDPNYPLYLHLLGQGNAHMLIETEMDKRLAELNPKGTKKEDKWSEADFNKFKYREMLLEMGNSVLSGDNMTFFDRLNRLDEDSATLAAIQIISSQSSEEDRKIIEKFYTVEMEDDGETVKSMSLKPQYESVLKQIGRIGRAMDEGNVDRVVAQSSTLMNMYKDNDPAGIITANTITSLFNRIYDARNLSPELKQEMMMGVFYSNKEFAQRNPEELRELLGDNYDHFTDLMNEMIYQWDGQVISNMESIITSGNEDTASKSKAISGAKQLSSAFKKLSMNYGSKGGGTTRTGNKAGQGYGEWVPVKIKGADLVKQLGLKGYSPVNPAKTVFTYKPHTDLSLAKDVNRQVKGPTTETVSSKKQLSDIEKKTTKALEAES